MESFSPQGRRAPLPFSVRLCEGASPRPRWGAMAALRLRLRLGAPKARFSQLYQSHIIKKKSSTKLNIIFHVELNHLLKY